MDVPFTGCSFQTLCLARNKALTKRLFQGAGLPTAGFFVVEKLPVPECPLEWPVIVKPSDTDGSVGLDQGSVVTDQEALTKRVTHVLETYGCPVLVEQFIAGREFNIGLVEGPELLVLPIAEILFVEKGQDFWPIVTYDGKWKPGSRDYESTPPQFPADVTPKLAERLQILSKQAFQLLGCRDYARVDVRVRPSGKPYLLEVNPNPDYSPTAGLAAGLTAGGIDYDQFTVDMVRQALARGGRPKPAHVVAAWEPVIRPAVNADLESLRQISESCGVFRPDEIAAALSVAKEALEKGKNKKGECLVAEQNGKVVGWCNFSRLIRTKGTFQLHWIAVAAESQGQGLGYRLLKEVEDRITAAQCKVLVTETSSVSESVQARQFFLRQSFRLVGDVPDYYDEGQSRLTYAKFFDGVRA